MPWIHAEPSPVRIFTQRNLEVPCDDPLFPPHLTCQSEFRTGDPRGESTGTWQGLNWTDGNFRNFRGESVPGPVYSGRLGTYTLNRGYMVHVGDVLPLGA